MKADVIICSEFLDANFGSVNYFSDGFGIISVEAVIQAL